MSLFRIGGAAGARTVRAFAPVNARFVSNITKADPALKTNTSDAPTETHSSSSLINKEGASEAITRHQLDYDATIDHGTSYGSQHWFTPDAILLANVFSPVRYRMFSPVPKRVMNGSEPGEVLPAAVLSGAPTDLQARTVR